MVVFQYRHGFINDGHKYVGYIYVDPESNRSFSAAHLLGGNIWYINEIDEGLTPEDNIYSTITANTLMKAKKKIENLAQK